MKNKTRKLLFTITNCFFIIILLIFLSGSAYIAYSIKQAPNLEMKVIEKKISSKVYDNDGEMVKQLVLEDYKDIKYEDLPDVFVNALLSCEDVRFFLHNGIDLPRLISALKNDVTSFSYKQGASTITQQLAKNMFLSRDKTISRKIKEIYLANKIESLYSKKEILEFYCNYICFDGVNNGINSAVHKFFNKSISEVSLPEAAFLAGIVNLPTVYNPYNNPEAANKRKNKVLELMLTNGYIIKSQYDNAISINIKSLLYEKPKSDKTYPYQAYIDIVYEQIKEKTGYDIYTTPMEIHTYMNTNLQNVIDNIQAEKDLNITFNNDLLQLASSIIDNKTGAIIASFGGRNYTGEKLFNRAYDMKKQPASTIKVVFEYALAFQYLNWSNKQVLNDVPINYPHSSIAINNVDNNYMGEVYVSDALGYSRNTTAIDTLIRVENKIGYENLLSYLKSINLMDEGDFAYSYGLGGYKYGVTMTNLAAAYSMIARGGLYIEPLTIKYIKLLDDSQKIITFTPEKKKILDDTSCYLLTDCLLQMMDNNIWNIKASKANNVVMVSKTGTSSFDKSTINKNNYPNNAAKDRLTASFSSDYSIATWTGFDETLPNKKTYFSSNSEENNLAKKFNKYIFSLVASKNQDFIMPSGLKVMNIVKGSNNLLATYQVDERSIEKALFKENHLPNSYFVENDITQTVIYDYFILDDYINFFFEEEKNEYKYNKIYDYEASLGGKYYMIDVYENDFLKETINTTDLILTYPIDKKNKYRFDIYFKYKNGLNKGPISELAIN